MREFIENSVAAALQCKGDWGIKLPQLPIRNDVLVYTRRTIKEAYPFFILHVTYISEKEVPVVSLQILLTCNSIQHRFKKKMILGRKDLRIEFL